jgi:hypothetical protein
VLDQLAHTAPTNADGGCTCEQELQHARRCLAAVHTAQADVAGRIARLARAASSGSTASAKAAVQESDWESVTAHTLSVGAPGRVAQRLFDRLLLLPLSHHHRFPLYEQASGQALARDQHMASAELRVPPRAVRLATDAAATVVGGRVGLGSVRGVKGSIGSTQVVLSTQQASACLKISHLIASAYGWPSCTSHHDVTQEVLNMCPSAGGSCLILPRGRSTAGR